MSMRDRHRRMGQHPFGGGGQTEFCPNGEDKLFVTRPRQGEKLANELLQCLFFDGRRLEAVLGPYHKKFDTRYLCSKH